MGNRAHAGRRSRGHASLWALIVLAVVALAVVDADLGLSFRGRSVHAPSPVGSAVSVGGIVHLTPGGDVTDATVSEEASPPATDPPYVMPDVIGLPIERAREDIRSEFGSSGVVAEVPRVVERPERDRIVVVGQTPSTGDLTDVPDTVTLRLGVVVPDVVDETVATATDVLGSVSLGAAVDPADAAEDRLVQRQDPGAGDLAPLGATIALVAAPSGVDGDGSTAPAGGVGPPARESPDDPTPARQPSAAPVDVPFAAVGAAAAALVGAALIRGIRRRARERRWVSQHVHAFPRAALPATVVIATTGARSTHSIGLRVRRDIGVQTVGEVTP